MWQAILGRRRFYNARRAAVRVAAVVLAELGPKKGPAEASQEVKRRTDKAEKPFGRHKVVFEFTGPPSNQLRRPPLGGNVGKSGAFIGGRKRKEVGYESNSPGGSADAGWNPSSRFVG
jgi:hypothetical protein